MRRDAWECSCGLWRVQNRGSILIGKAILDPNCPIRRHPTRSHGLANNPSNGNSVRGSLSRDNGSDTLRFTALALSLGSSSDMCAGVCLYDDATDEGGIGALRLWRIRLADSPTILPQGSNHCSGSILSSHTARIPHNHFDPRTSHNCDRPIDFRTFFLFAPQLS